MEADKSGYLYWAPLNTEPDADGWVPLGVTGPAPEPECDRACSICNRCKCTCEDDE